MSALAEVLVLWATVAIIPLSAFYLRFPFISSRYLLDFAPAFSAVLMAFFCLLLRWTGKHRRWRMVGVAIFLAWWGWEITEAKIYKVPGTEERTWTWPEVAAGMEAERTRAPFEGVPLCYSNGMALDPIKIPFNGAGWQPRTGEAGPCVTLFIENPDCVEVEVSPAAGKFLALSEYNCIQAKVGLESLERESMTPTTEGLWIVFRGPKRKMYQQGVQLLSLGMVYPRDLSTGHSKFRLLRVDWHREPAEAGNPTWSAVEE